MPIHGYPGNVITANPTAPTSSVASGVWTTEQQLAAVAAGNWPLYVPPYQISRSLRFNSADSAYLNRTPASTTNRRTWTWSGWVKRSASSSTNMLLGAFNGFNQGDQRTSLFISSDKLVLETSLMQTAAIFNFETTQVFRDFSAWYHIVAVLDTTQATSTNRIKFYVNGVQVTSFSRTDVPSQNYDAAVNANTSSHFVNRYYDSSAGNFYGDQYLAEIYFIDGQALTPSSFGETNTSTGVWQAKAYSGSYGTNGFYINFSDNSNTTAATLGKDYSGNGNNWTPNNLSVTAGVGNDSLVDSPASYSPGDTGVGGQVRGNYCTLNSLSTTAGTYTQGNLRYVGASAFRRSNGTIAVSTGKWYWEVTLGNNPYSPRNSGSVYNAFGFGLSTVFNSTTAPISTTDAIILQDSGYYKNFSGAVTDAGSAFVSGDVLSIAVDLDANTFTFYKNNTQLVTGTIGGTAGRELVPIIISDSATYGVMDCNFGQRPFAYTAPSGFSCLVTTNLPTPTIGATSTTQANQYFDVKLATGSNIGSATLGAFSSVLAWIKDRVNINNHQLLDSVRGTSGSDVLQSNTTSGTVSYSTPTGNSVGWVWKANGAGSSNTAGTITSTVSANTTSGFSIISYTGNKTSGATIGHGLGVAPAMVIIKERANASEWIIYHQSLGATQSIYFSTAAANTNSIWFNNTAPSSTVITLGNADGTNRANTMIAYAFAPVAGYSAFGSYTGNGSADGPFVYTGFRPRYVMTKLTSGTGDWVIQDAARDPYNMCAYKLGANSSSAENYAAVGNTTENTIDIVSNGFKLRSSNGVTNGSGGTFIYMAFAEFPFKFSLAR